jgi:Lrp/AsnC family leucine-responsive transcriptional regulator
MQNLKVELDATNRRILAELAADARISFSELGRRVGLTSPAVAERVRRLEDAGIIRGYHADINLSKLGYPIVVFISISFGSTQFPPIADFALQHPGVLEVFHITGDKDAMIKARLQSVEQLEAFLKKLVQFGKFSTAIVLDHEAGELTRLILDGS